MLKVVKNKNKSFTLEGMTEGKLLCLNRILKEEIARGDIGSGIVLDLSIAVEKGVVANIAHGTPEAY